MEKWHYYVQCPQCGKEIELKYATSNEPLYLPTPQHKERKADIHSCYGSNKLTTTYRRLESR